MLNRHHFRLRCLGQLSLASVVGDTEVASQVRPRHLAVLTVLALSRRTVTRDSLLEMFWGGETEVRARHSLSNALSGLRALLGSGAVTARQDQVSLAAEARLEVDVLQFTAACDSHDDDSALRLYAGPLLAGIHVPDAPEFDSWVARERGRLERLFLEACERRLPVLSRAGDWRRATEIAERWLDAAPRTATPFIALLRAHAGPATPVALSAALTTYDRVRASLDETYGIKPDVVVTTLAARLRDQLAACDQQLAVSAATTPWAPEQPSGAPLGELYSVSTAPSENTALSVMSPPAASVAPAAIAPVARRVRPLDRVRGAAWLRWAAASAVAVGLLAAIWRARQPQEAASPARPVVVVTSINDVRGDSATDWLRAGLPRMIANDLGTMGGIEVIAPTRVRDVLVRLTGSPLPRVTDDQALDVAHRLGASWVVTGGISQGDNGYLLDVTMRNVAVPTETQSFTILSRDAITLGRMTASKLGALLNVSPSGNAPRFAGIETASPEAYRHFIRGMLAGDAEQLALASREFDAAIGLDSGFVVAVRNRRAIARALGDAETDRRLAPLEQRFQDRLPELDRLSDQIKDIDSLGEHSRAAALADQALKRFPHDPRAYSLRAELFMKSGRWASAESILVRELALDSLAISAGDGPCTPCEVLWPLSAVRLARGDRAGAEQAARRWAELQPDLPGAWRSLSATLAAVGASAEAVEAGFHYVALSNATPALVEFGRTMVAARRLDIADSLVRTWRGSSDPVLQDGEIDLQSTIERERGDYAASVATLANLPLSNGSVLVRADGLARLGRLAEARAIYEATGHPRTAGHNGQFTASEARGFAWSHALEADALMRAGDTTTAKALIDSLLTVGRQSYFQRDWLLHHHVRGLMLFAEGRLADAERELRAAESIAGGWTRTNVELARVQLAERRPADAIATLRDAYTAPVDAMGRYVPRSELDWWMSWAFEAAGQRDSAAVYAAYVRAAWKNVDHQATVAAAKVR